MIDLFVFQVVCLVLKKFKKICVVSGSRAEFGLLYNLLKKIDLSNSLSLKLVVTGSHLSLKHDLTYKSIEQEGFKIDDKINLKILNNQPIGVVNQMSLAMSGFAKTYNKLKPDLLIILGDRYEIFCAAVVATVYNIPIAHIHGGEVTKGSIDNSFRHSITQMSNFHFVATRRSILKVAQLKDSKKNIFHVGSLGVESIKELKLLSKKKLEELINFKFNLKTFLITFHSETLSNVSIPDQIEPLLEALQELKDVKFLFTMSNSDVGGDIINSKISNFVSQNNERAYLIKNLGHLRYLSSIKYSCAVIGNSSSGIIEAPSINTPSINIGNRQYGREKSSSVIDCKNIKEKIFDVCNSILNDWSISSNLYENPYEKKNTSKNIIKILEKIDMEELEIK